MGAPPDSEMEVAYNRPYIKFQKISSDPSIVFDVKTVEVGFDAEIYLNNEEGFRSLRTNDGLPMKPEINVK